MSRTTARQRQSGFTLVEVIITLAVGALVIATLAPIFLLVNRVSTIWTNHAQARAVGILAEESLTRDLRQYGVLRDADCAADSCPSRLVLHPGTDPDFRVEYVIETGASDLPQLVRTVRQGGTGVSTIVAHGVTRLATCHTSQGLVRIDMTLTGFGGQPVDMRPRIFVTPRLGGGGGTSCQ